MNSDEVAASIQVVLEGSYPSGVKDFSRRHQEQQRIVLTQVLVGKFGRVFCVVKLYAERCEVCVVLHGLDGSWD